MKIRKGDRVRVLTGKDRGKDGTVTVAYPATEQGDRRRRQRGQEAPEARRPRTDHQGGIIDKEMPMPVSNVAIVCSVVRQAHPGRLPVRARRHQGPHLPQVPGGL